MKIADIENMNDIEFMRLMNGNDKSITSVDQLTVGHTVRVKKLGEYVFNDSRDWNLEGYGYSTTVNGEIFHLPMHMVDKSNKEMEIIRISSDDRVVLEDGYHYLLDMIEFI